MRNVPLMILLFLCPAATAPAAAPVWFNPHVGVRAADAKAGPPWDAAKSDRKVVENGITFNIVYQDAAGQGFQAAGALGANRRARLEDALRYVARTLNEGGTLDVLVRPSETDGTGPLGVAFTGFALANTIQNGSAFQRLKTGVKPFADSPEIEIVVDFGYTYNVAEDPPAPGQFDLWSVLVHEITHSVGFVSLVDADGSSRIKPNGPYSTLDTLSFRGLSGDYLVGGNPPAFTAQVADLASDDILFDGNAGVAAFGGTPKIDSVAPYRAGRSLSHFDQGIPGGAVMRPALGAGLLSREYAAVEIGALKDLGYSAAAMPGGDVEICNDGIDNDGDGFVDCDDFDCAEDPACLTPVEICDDGIDNDGDGFVDCDDFDCAGDPACLPPVEICDDGIDNNGNGFVDCEDFSCAEDPVCGGLNPALLVCPAAAEVSQPPAEITAMPGFSDESDNQIRAYDNFSGVTRPITGLVWWGGGMNPAPCVRPTENYMIGFFADNGGQPGTLLYSVAYSDVVGQPTGLDAGLGEIRRYEVPFFEPLELAAGWVSVYAVGNFTGCFFYWANGTGGNNFAYSTAGGTQSTDYAFCLITAPARHSADQNGDGLISLSELLRVIQFFNSLRYGCGVDTEDGYAPDGVDEGCAPHASDYNPQDWRIVLTELLRLIQFYNSGGYHPCETGEDGFCPGQP